MRDCLPHKLSQPEAPRCARYAFEEVNGDRLDSGECFYFGSLEAARKRQSCHKLVIGNWNITSLTRKEHDLVEQAKGYSLDVVCISFTKRHGSKLQSCTMGGNSSIPALSQQSFPGWSEDTCKTQGYLELLDRNSRYLWQDLSWQLCWWMDPTKKGVRIEVEAGGLLPLFDKGIRPNSNTL